jgi:hypothetical protein
MRAQWGASGFSSLTERAPSIPGNERCHKRDDGGGINIGPPCEIRLTASAFVNCGHAVAYVQGSSVPEAAVSNRSKTVTLFDHLVGGGEQRRWHFEAKRLGGG